MQESKGITIRTVSSQEEIKVIFRIRYENYLRKGYISQSPAGIMTDQWDELPGTVHFAALLKGNIVGAVRLVTDSANGLPMERVFVKEIADLRKQKRMIAEASSLVTLSDNCKSDQKTWLKLSKAVWQEAESRQIDDLCIAVTENHLGFYQRLLFEVIGEKRQYQSLNGIWAWPLRVQVGKARTKDRLHGHDNDRSLRKCFLGGSQIG